MPEELVFLMETLKIFPVTIKQMKRWTDRNPVMATVRRFVKQGWTKSVKSEFHPHHSRKLELPKYSGWLSTVRQSDNCPKARKYTTSITTA